MMKTAKLLLQLSRQTITEVNKTFITGETKVNALYSGPDGFVPN